MSVLIHLPLPSVEHHLEPVHSNPPRLYPHTAPKLPTPKQIFDQPTSKHIRTLIHSASRILRS
ncbi:hypothetical protein B0O99DRAFT_636419 [Bisporella sp. PMI_857]|nr:hypothetical protein B0O99DRAFT_636419 [Bisporella sp. PMI_857]